MKWFLIFVFSTVFFYSCIPKCEEYLCDNGGYKKVRFLSKSDSTSLFFTNSRKYNYKDILFFYRSNNKIDTVWHNINSDVHWNYNHTNLVFDSVVTFGLPFVSSRLYVKFSPTEIDSFEYKFQVSNNKCCPSGFYDYYDFSF